MYVQASTAINLIQPGSSVFIHTAVAAPQVLIRELTQQANRLSPCNIYQLHTEGEAPYTHAEYESQFHTHCFFIGANCREAVQAGRASYIPVFLSEVPLLFRRGVIKSDVALITVSEPDHHGYCSLGVSVDTTKAAMESSSLVIAQVNKYMPRTHGDSQVHISNIHAFVEGHLPLPEISANAPDENTQTIGSRVAELVDDGATLQIGIGEIPDAVLAELIHHKDLGVHTELFSDGILPLVEKGVINGRRKKKYREKIVSTFIKGTRKLYEFVNDNPIVAMLDCSYVNDSGIIRQNPKVTAINSAIEIDITGQVCADSIGTKMYSGVGGQMDFIRGAALSERGKAIIAMPSTTSGGISRIVPVLRTGAGVVTTRAHVHYVVTEYGTACLFGKDLKQRARALVEIAHPNHRDMLLREAHERFGSLKNWV
ncbi:MAG: acetyl-CoA hydrolase/transferase family protein [Bacteroidota bacterium]